MLRRLAWTAAVLGLPAALAAANADLIRVTNVRSWSHADTTRVIVEMTGKFEYHSDMAVNPDRLYVDILHSTPWIARKRYATHEINDRLVHRVRVAETAPGVTRIVFDLASPIDFSIMTLTEPERLVVELRPHGGAPPARTKAATPSLSARVEPPVTTPLPGAFARNSVVPAGAKKPLYRRPFVSPAPVVPAWRQMLYAGVPPSSPLPSFDTNPLWFIDAQSLVASLPGKYENSERLSVSPASTAGSTRVLPAVRSTASTNAAPLASENASRSLTRALGLKVNRIVIDAGHGGHDDGTIGPHGVLEKDVVLDVALRLAKLVQQKMGAEVVLTRSDDTFIPLQERTAIANEHKADLFLSIHANSSPAPEVAGTETFFLNFTNSPDALNVAARENAGSDKSVGELKDLIQTITLNDKIEESHTFADDIQTAIQSQAARANPAAHNRGVKRAPFVVLIGASMPSVLAEIGFLSNPRDENNLNKPEYRQKVAEALYKGLAQYAQSLSHFEPSRQLAKSDGKTRDKQGPVGLNQ